MPALIDNPNYQLRPCCDLAQVLKELKLDPNNPNFSEMYMLDELRRHSQNRMIPPQGRERIGNCLMLLAPHNFWKTQPIMQPRQLIEKVGQIE